VTFHADRSYAIAPHLLVEWTYSKPAVFVADLPVSSYAG
jgi:hypothetical protein